MARQAFGLGLACLVLAAAAPAPPPVDADPVHAAIDAARRLARSSDALAARLRAGPVSVDWLARRQAAQAALLRDEGAALARLGAARDQAAPNRTPDRTPDQGSDRALRQALSALRGGNAPPSVGTAPADRSGPPPALVAPVAGRVVTRWGEVTDAGPATGISYAVPAASPVVAACGGQVLFAGPFRSFGQVLILDCGGGWRVVQGGLERLDTVAGRRVSTGAPVGRLGPRSALLLELHHRDTAIDPGPFLKGSRR